MNRLRLILTYGLIAGVLVAAGLVGGALVSQSGLHQVRPWFGYLIMLAALSSILVGVRQYRDLAPGGTITFGAALLIGVGISAVASVAFALIWEIYLAATQYGFVDRYIDATLAAKRASGVTGAAYQKLIAETEVFRRHYANPLLRLLGSFAQVFPVGLLVAVASAALLRDRRFLPARSRPMAASPGKTGKPKAKRA